MRARLSSALVLASAASAALFGSVPAGSAATPCDRLAAPAGSDTGTGTLEMPFRTAGRLVDSLAPGETGCFRRGLYSFGVLNVNRPDVTLAPFDGEAVTLKGDIKVLPAGAGATLEGMRLNGAGGANEIGPRIYADRVVLRDNEITNHHTGICIHINSFESSNAPRNVLIERNRIHACGRLPATNHHHGIYIADARATVIRDNWIYDNADRGIQQYPNTQGSLITGNVIDSNGQGVNFGGDDSNANCSNDNVVQGNVITYSRLRWNAYSGAQGRDCTGNLVRNNCVKAERGDYAAAGGIEPDSRSFDAAANLVAQPRYLAAAVGDYRLQADSGCLAKYTGTMAVPGAPPPPTTGRVRPRVKLKVTRHHVPAGRRVRVKGVVAPATGPAKVIIERSHHGNWRRAGKTAISHGGRFKDRVRVRGGHVVRLRARIPGVGRSRVVRVRVGHG